MSKTSAEKKKYWEDKIKVWKDSKIPITRWCREEEISISTFQYWREQTRDLDEKGQQSSQKKNKAFIEIPIELSKKTSGIAIQYDDITVSIEPDFSKSTFMQVITLLKELSC
jgi:hypothetical protein